MLLPGGIEILPNDPKIHLKDSRLLEPVCKSLLELQERAATVSQSYAELLVKTMRETPKYGDLLTRPVGSPMVFRRRTPTASLVANTER
jgi:hypothetical protein